MSSYRLGILTFLLTAAAVQIPADIVAAPAVDSSRMRLRPGVTISRASEVTGMPADPRRGSLHLACDLAGGRVVVTHHCLLSTDHRFSRSQAASAHVAMRMIGAHLIGNLA